MAALTDWRVIVLGAGRGSRMGTPKALMTFRGRSWWRFQRERLEEICERPIFVVSQSIASEIARDADARACDTDLVIAPDDAPMFASVLAGLRRVLRAPRENTESTSASARAAGVSGGGIGVSLLPIDTPVPLRSTWQSVTDSATRERRPACPSTAPGVHGHPLAIPFTWLAEQRPDLMRPDHADTPPAPSERLDEIIRPARLIVPVTDPRCTMNLNTPADLEAFQAFERANP